MFVASFVSLASEERSFASCSDCRSEGPSVSVCSTTTLRVAHLSTTNNKTFHCSGQHCYSGFSYRVFSNGFRAILHEFGAVPPAVGAGDAVDGGHLSCVLHDGLLHLAQMFHLLLVELNSVQVRLLCCVQETIRPKRHPRQLKAAFASVMFRL